jgi:hypothetical protein
MYLIRLFSFSSFLSNMSAYGFLSASVSLKIFYVNIKCIKYYIEDTFGFFAGKNGSGGCNARRAEPTPGMICLW